MEEGYEKVHISKGEAVATLPANRLETSQSSGIAGGVALDGWTGVHG